MRKLLLLVLGGFLASALTAQVKSKLDIALRHLQEKHEGLGLESTDFKDMVVSFESTDERGISYIYFNQTVNGFPIKNAILNYTISPQDKVAFVGNTFVSGKDKKVTSDRVSVTAEKAFEAAADHLGYGGIKAPAVVQRNGDKSVFGPSALTDNLVTAEMKYDLKEGKLVPVWELTMDMKDNADYWEIRMNAADGSFVSKNNLTVYCNHQHGKYAKHEKCEAHAYSQMQSHNVKVDEALSGTATYRVYALPAESPSHGSHTLITDPHFPEVSPFGWHDTNGVDGPEYTITRGNNVNAYADKNDDDDVDADVAQPDGGSALVFDFAHDKSKEPVESPAAAQTNLFYMVNMMHDISALYGFNEEWGNFQTKNYTNKGNGNDYVLAQAFDGFSVTPPKTDNANFSTPADGGNGRMQMFLWTSPGGGLRIDSPDAIKGFIESYGTADFGNPVPLSTEPAITGSVVIAKDTDLSNPTACCKSITTDLTGKIALIDRGLCNFSQKAKLAEDKGAIAVIICNISGVNGGNGEEISNMTAGAISPDNIVSVFLKKSDCDKIRLQLNNGVDVVMTIQEATSGGPRFLDGAFDNGIIAHEFGHGISTRLTGGPANSGCLSNGEQMGEGWSDFFSLITTVEPGDKGSDVRGIGTYAQGEPTSGGGIRRFPYSTDMTVNPQTFDDIKGTETNAPCNGCHARGEIWTDCLWDLYWALVDKYGYDANWRNFESGNAKTLSLVIQAMKMQGCNPGFIRGRDAILAADSLLFGGVNGYTIWDVFARRGLGFYADGGDANNFNDGVENFDTNPYAIAKLKINKDNLPLVKPGEEVTVSMSTVSHIPAAQSGVVVTDNMPPDFTYVDGSASVPATVVGSDVKLSLGEVVFNQSNNITYKMRAGDKKSLTLAIYGFEGFEDSWNLDGSKGTSSWFQTDVAYKSGETAFYIYEEETEVDQYLISPDFDIVGQNPALRFWHRFDTEIGVDGGFLEVSTDGGNVWQIIRDGFIKNGYNNELSYGTFAIPSLRGFSGTTNDQFIDTYLDLTPWKGQTIKIRFRFGSNPEGGVSSKVLRGWFIDDVEVMDLLVYETVACVTNADNENGSCSEIRKIVIDSDGIVSSKDVTNRINYAVYPNPAHDYMVVELEAAKAGAANFQVTTLDGKLVYKQSVKINEGRNVQTILTHTFQSGVYLVQVQTADGIGVQKIVIR